ncbi:hypothetical protein RB653_002164 [Dictyostelium firmibasis]|uniref:ethanolamine kinase n=1 Tax=Dictyostelium firmibasis TaxID=79012 RepID=A0AAN7TQ42_9MYCE
MNEFEDIIYPNAGPSHVTTNIEFEDENMENNENYLNLVQILKELVDNNLKEDIEFKPMVGGVTNTLFKSSFITGQGSNKSVIIRLYGKGSEQFIDRKTEANIQYLLSKNGVGPKFYGTFENGCIYGYVEGDQLQLEDLYQNNILSLIAKETGRWHSLKLDIYSTQLLSSSSDSSIKESTSPSTLSPRNMIAMTPPSSTSLFKNLNSWINNALTLASKEAKGSMISKINLNYYKEEAMSLMSFIEEHYSGEENINFCHNDLIPRNMIYDKEKNQVRFIDFEYSGYNFRGYDIGNFFCEFSGLDLDYTKYPSIEIQKRFIKNYLISINNCKIQQQKQQKLKEQQQLDSPSEMENDELLYEPSKEEIHNLYIESNHLTLGSHLMWGFWGIIQHFSSSIDFDYIDYAVKRFKQYDLVKNKVLSLK